MTTSGKKYNGLRRALQVVGVVLYGSALVWCGYGDQFFDSHNETYGYFSAYGDVQIDVQGQLTRRYWKIYDLNLISLLIILSTTVTILSLFKINERWRKAGGIFFLTLILNYVIDFFEVIITNSTYNWKNVELSVLAISFIAFFNLVRVVALTRRMQNKLEVEVETAIVLKNPMSRIAKLFNKKIEVIDSAAILKNWAEVEDSVVIERAEKWMAEQKRGEKADTQLTQYSLYIKNMETMLSMYEKYKDEEALDSIKQTLAAMGDTNREQLETVRTKGADEQ